MTRLILCSLLSALLFLPTHAAEVSFPLPDPDGKPGDATKPIKVYILAGQSNMVGMGNLSGAKNVYDGVYLSSNSGVPDGPLQIYKVGNYKTAPLAVYLPDGTKTDKPIAEGQLEVPHADHVGLTGQDVDLDRFCRITRFAVRVRQWKWNLSSMGWEMEKH